MPNGALILTKIDESTLKRIAATTLGQYFRAKDEKSLSEIYEQIDALETTKIKSSRFTTHVDYFPKLVWTAFIIFLFELGLSSIVFVRLP